MWYLSGTAGKTTHWRCINDCMWSSVPAVQVISYRMLQALSDQDWAQDLLGMIYMDDETLEWADGSGGDVNVHKDSNGNILLAGDTVNDQQIFLLTKFVKKS